MTKFRCEPIVFEEDSLGIFIHDTAWCINIYRDSSQILELWNSYRNYKIFTSSIVGDYVGIHKNGYWLLRDSSIVGLRYSVTKMIQQLKDNAACVFDPFHYRTTNFDIKRRYVSFHVPMKSILL